MTEKETSLAWMPLYIKETKALRASLTTLQYGALMALRVHSWNEPIPATLPDDDVRLASLSGLTEQEWRENGDVIRDFLKTTDPDDKGRRRLVDPEVRELWQEQWKKYVSASTRGGKGGRPKGAGKQDGKQMEKLGESSAFQELSIPLGSELKSSSIQTTEESKAGEKLSLAEQEWNAANPGKRVPLTLHLPQPAQKNVLPADDVYGEIDQRANSEAARRAVEEMEAGNLWLEDMAASLETYRDRFPKAYHEHEQEAYRILGYLNKQQLIPDQRSRLDEVIRDRVIQEQGWKTKTEYVRNRCGPAPVRSVARASGGLP